MHEGALPDHREEEGPAGAAARVVEVFLSEDGELVNTLLDRELLPLDAGEGLEGGAGCRPALRAVAIRRVKERI